MYKAEPSGGNTALLLLVPIRLGSDTLNVIYIPCIKVGVIVMCMYIVHCCDHFILFRHYCQWIIVLE